MPHRPPAGRCLRCWLPPTHCLCPVIPLVRVQTRFLVIRHWKEGFETTNSARLAALAMPTVEILDYGAPGAPLDPRWSPPRGAWLLFPPEEGEPQARPGVDPPPSTIVVPDGSWRQARRMVHRLGERLALPRLALAPKAAPPRRIRKPPFEGGMATLESIARAVALLEGDESSASLLEDLQAEMVRRVQLLRGLPPDTGY